MCKKEKPFSEFNKNKSRKDKHDCYCRECRNLYIKNNAASVKESKDKYNENNSDKVKFIKMAYKENNKEKISEYNRNRYKSVVKPKNLLSLYNLSIQDYERMLQEQNGVCKICEKPEPRVGWALSVDHNHMTGTVRGLLCSNCNGAIGMMYEDIEILRRAIKYLEIDKTKF